MKPQEQEGVSSPDAGDPSAFYNQVLESGNNANRFSGANGIFVETMTSGCASGSMEVTERVLNALGAVHGGALATLADVVAGMAVTTAGYSCVTLNSTMNYLREVRQGKVYCAAKLVKSGRTISVCDVELTDGENLLVATGTYTFYLKDKISELITD